MKIENNLRRSCCPLCGSESLKNIGKVAYANPMTFSSHEIELTHKPELWRCHQCMSCFTQNIIPETVARNLYKSGASNTRWGSDVFENTKSRESITALSGLFRDGVRLLDIGSNGGELLDFAKERGCITAGVEFSEPSRDILRANGHDAYFSVEDVVGCFDIIAAFDLFEHLYDVNGFLETCRRKLTSTGCMVILTGNIESLSSRLSGSKWWYAGYPEHIVFPSLRYFSVIPGFVLESIQHTYASVAHKRSLIVIAAGLLARFFNGNYRGLPSLGPDHLLVVLRNTGGAAIQSEMA